MFIPGKEHPIGDSSLSVKMPLSFPQSSVLKIIGVLENIAFTESENHAMEIGFDGENSGKSKSFFPELPLIIRW